MKAMVLAAGKGERMRPLTLDTPKPLLQVGGKSLLTYHLENLSASGIKDIVINHAWLGEKIESSIGNGESFGVDIVWSPEGEPLETAGGILQALPLLEDDTEASFICVNSDIWTDYSLKDLSAVDGVNTLAWLVLVKNPDHNSQGDFLLEDGRVKEPTIGQQEGAYTFSGIAVYHPALFEGLSPGKQSIVPLLKQAMAKGQVGGEYFEGQWFDIGTPERLDALEELLS